MQTSTASLSRSDERGIHEIELLDGESIGKDLFARWLKELDSPFPRSLFQSSEYFDFLLATERPGDLGVVLLTTVKSGQVCGLIPIRRTSHPLKLSVGKHAFGAITLNAIQILGSLPNMHALPQRFDELVQLLMQSFPDADALCLESVPVRSWLWRHMSTSETIRQSFHVYVPYGPRQWYSIDLPQSFRQYQGRFSAKQRYNLTRQVRRLRDHGGGLLQLRRIASAEHVQEFVASMETLATQQERTEILRPNQYAALADRGLLLSFVLVCGALPCAIAFGTRHASTLQVHTLFYDRSVWPLSPGTTLQYMIVQNVIETGVVSRIEFGYSPGTASTSSVNDGAAKGQVLLMRKNKGNLAKKIFHELFCEIILQAKRFCQRSTATRIRVAGLFAARTGRVGR